jgi:hypothetical protein
MRKNMPTILASVFRIGFSMVLFSTISRAEDSNSRNRDAQRYIQAVSEFADNVLSSSIVSTGRRGEPIKQTST